MYRILAFRVVKEYRVYGWTGLYRIELQSSNDYNWHRVADYFSDIKKAERVAQGLAKIHNVTAYDLGGYEIK